MTNATTEQRIPSPLTIAMDGDDFALLSFVGSLPATLRRPFSMRADEFSVFVSRLAASFNACDGIDTSVLESWGLGGINATHVEVTSRIRAAEDRVVYLTAAVAEARDERDAALAALRGCVADATPAPGHPEWASTATARAILARNT